MTKEKRKILIIVGTRPNFIKVTQFKKLAESYPKLEIKIVHTGQHFDDKMADVFFKQFCLTPDYFLNVPPGSANSQIANIMISLERLVNESFRPDLMMVVGDVNSTLAGAITANKLNIPLAHLESGLRSFDESMPEEHNRVVADKLSSLFFVTEQSGFDNLVKEGTDTAKIKFVGNTMIDTMVAFEKEIDSAQIIDHLKLKKNEFVLMTMHRPATVDNKDEFEKLLDLIELVSEKYKVVFPVHPRTIKNAEQFGLSQRMRGNNRMICTEPLAYFDFQKLIKDCAFIITDSGGIQEESTFRLKPCITLRPNTERPVTTTEGTNTLVSFDNTKVAEIILQIQNGSYKKGSVPKFWDGKSTGRILKILSEL